MDIWIWHMGYGMCDMGCWVWIWDMDMGHGVWLWDMGLGYGYRIWMCDMEMGYGYGYQEHLTYETCEIRSKKC